MASNTFVQFYADGSKRKLHRSARQGRKSSGLGKPILIRLYETDEDKLKILETKLGEYWNLNEFVRMAVHSKLDNSVYTEFLKQ